MIPITPYQRQQIREALAREPQRRQIPQEQRRKAKERGCSLEHGRYEREMIHAAYAEAARRRNEQAMRPSR